MVEVRKYAAAPVLGLADFQSGIDGACMGNLRQATLCRDSGSYHGGESYKALGVVTHLTKPCTDQLFCFGQWAAQNTDHWLWEGSGLSDNERFGIGRETARASKKTFAVGHEADTWVQGMPLPGLADGQQAVILAEGTDFDETNPSRGVKTLDGGPNAEKASDDQPRTIEDIVGLIGREPPEDEREEVTNAGTILYFPHSAGGQVLVIGATATPWALQSDATLSGLLVRALDCFANDVGCGSRPR